MIDVIIIVIIVDEVVSNHIDSDIMSSSWGIAGKGSLKHYSWMFRSTYCTPRVTFCPFCLNTAVRLLQLTQTTQRRCLSPARPTTGAYCVSYWTDPQLMTLKHGI